MVSGGVSPSWVWLLCLAGLFCIAFLEYAVHRRGVITPEQTVEGINDNVSVLKWVVPLTSIVSILTVLALLRGPIESNSAMQDYKDFWEPLSIEQENALTEKLRPLVSSKIVVSCSIIECRELARSFIGVFKKAGWSDVQPSIGGVDTVGIEGVAIFPPDSTAKTLRDLIESTTDLSVTLFGELREVSDQPTTYISIGSKPL